MTYSPKTEAETEFDHLYKQRPPLDNRIAFSGYGLAAGLLALVSTQFAPEVWYEEGSNPLFVAGAAFAVLLISAVVFFVSRSERKNIDTRMDVLRDQIDRAK